MRNELGSDPFLVPEQDSAHLADEPLSIFSERPAEGLVGPLVWCDHMDLLATMHVTPQEGAASSTHASMQCGGNMYMINYVLVKF